MFKINVNCICCEKGKDKILCLLLKISGVEVRLPVCYRKFLESK